MPSVKRRPLGARRHRAERYLVITIAAFAVTVAGVRWYLDLAGYPTIGSGDLHVAHVLWGGLALFLAAMLPLLWVGRRVLKLSALLAGVGVGLFIDEVGKFLTTSNDYFFAPAAPIIYGGILLLVLFWLLVRRRGDNMLDATQAVIEALRSGIDGSLTGQDRTRVIEGLRETHKATGKTDQDDPIAESLLVTLNSAAMDDRLAAEGWIARGDARRTLERILPTRVERWLVVIGLIWNALAAALAALTMVAVSGESIELLEEFAASSGRLEIPTEPFWILLLLGITVVAGTGCAIALALMWRGRGRLAMDVGLAAILISLVVGGLIGFYATQFTALTSMLTLLVLLGLIVDRRIRLERMTMAVDDGAD